MAPTLQCTSAHQTQPEEVKDAHTQRFAEYLDLVGSSSRSPLLASVGKDLLQVSAPSQDSEIASARKKLRIENTGLNDLHFQARAALLKPGLGRTVLDPYYDWHNEAVARWGPGVPALNLVSDWKIYVTSRLPVLIPSSPCDIMQERYAYDAWRLLAACTLMTRISSERIKDETIATFFLHYQTPSMFLDKARTEGKTLQEIIRPLGMTESRCKTLTELSQRFLEMPVFDIGHKKGINKIFGCGPFAVDSYFIFCRGHLLPETADSLCQEYLGWRKHTSCQDDISGAHSTGTTPSASQMKQDEEKENAKHIENDSSHTKSPLWQKRQSSLFAFFKSSTS